MFFIDRLPLPVNVCNGKTYGETKRISLQQISEILRSHDIQHVYDTSSLQVSVLLSVEVTYKTRARS